MILKIIKSNGKVRVYQQLAGQFVYPKIFSGLSARIINWLVDNWFKRG